MTTKPSIGKRLLGMMLAVPMALAGMGIGATTAVAADTVPTDNLIAVYDFTTKPSDGKTVANSAPNATLGAAEVQNSADSLWADSALTRRCQDWFRRLGQVALESAARQGRRHGAVGGQSGFQHAQCFPFPVEHR